MYTLLVVMLNVSSMATTFDNGSMSFNTFAACETARAFYTENKQLKDFTTISQCIPDVE